MTPNEPEVETRLPTDEGDLAKGVVHDLAGALTAIQGWAELALSAPETVSPESALELVRASAATASRLARTLLRGNEESWADPVEVGHQVARLLRPAAARRGVTVSVEAPAEALPEMPEGACFSILWNLAHNAVALTEPRSAVAIRFGRGGTAIGFRVVDSGPGLDEEGKRRAFDAGFSQRPGGSGLGLSRVRHLVRELGGEVRLSDNPSGGLCVDVTLPMAERVASRAVRRSGVIARSDAHTASLFGARILVVDDDDALRQMLATSLRLRGAQCGEAGSVAQATQSSERWDMALVDLTLTDGSGMDLADELRSSGRARHIVCMSGQTSLPPHASFRPDAWLRKPFEAEDVVGVAKRLLAPDSERRSLP